MAPEVGGLTPTVDALRLTRRAVTRESRDVPVTVLIRSRIGGFGYSVGEFEQMRRDARRLLKAGADGIAFGFLHTRSGEIRIDAERCRVLVKLAHAHTAKAVFNRAFDCLPDRRTGLQDLIALGFDRVFTSGGRRFAMDGMSGFLTWLAPQYTQVRTRLDTERMKFRDQFVGKYPHARTPDIIANLLIGLHYLLGFAQAIGAIDGALHEELWQRGQTAGQRCSGRCGSVPPRSASRRASTRSRSSA